MVDIQYQRTAGSDDAARVPTSRTYLRRDGTDLVIETLDEFAELCSLTGNTASGAAYVFDVDAVVAHG